jgi:ribosomal protein S18 acetylase RimI-like enzyme
MDTQFLVRRAGQDDVAKIAQLVNSAYRPTFGSKGWTHEAALINGERTNTCLVKEAINSTVILIGIQDEEIVACVQVERKGDEAYISMLAVAPGLQDSGLGKIMLSEAETYAHTALKIDQLALVVVSARRELIEFYMRRGYSSSGEKLPYPVQCGVGRPKDEKLDLTILRKRYNNSLKPDASRRST